MPKPSAEATLFASVVRRQALVESIGLLRLSQPPSSSRLLVGRTRRTPATRIAAYGMALGRADSVARRRPESMRGAAQSPHSAETSKPHRKGLGRALGRVALRHPGDR